MNTAKGITPANIEMNNVVDAFNRISPNGTRVFYETYHEYPTTSSAELAKSHFKGIAAYKNQLIFTHTNLLPLIHSDFNPGKILIANKQTSGDQASISAIYDTNLYHYGWSHPCSAQACGSYMAMGLQKTDDSTCHGEIHILDLTPLDNGAQPVNVTTINSVNKSGDSTQRIAINGVAMTKEHGDDGKYIVAGVQGRLLTIYKSFKTVLDPTIKDEQFYVVGETIQNFPRSGAGLALITQTNGSIYLIALDTDDDKGSNNRIYLYQLTINDSNVVCSPEIASIAMPVPGLSEAVRYATGPALVAITAQDLVCGTFLNTFATGIQNINILNTSFRWGKGFEITSPDDIKVYATDRNDLTTSKFSWPVDTQKDFSLVTWATISGSGGSSVLPLNTPLTVGDTLVANNQQFFAVMQSDGNLCVYRGNPQNQGAYMWGSQATGGGGQFFTILQSDGNLCTYYGSVANQGAYLWGTQALADGGKFFLVMQDDGNLCVYKGSPNDNEGWVWGWM
ncbi:MAG: hypothetical protein ABI167_11110 [Nitrosospira sp.]